MTRRGAACGAALAVALTGCGGANGAPAGPPAAPAASRDGAGGGGAEGASVARPAGAGAFSGAWGRVVSRQLSLELVLPGAGAWRAEERARWLVVRHAASRSEIRARTWRAEKVSNHRDCEVEARASGAAIPEVDEVVDARALRAPEGYDTHVRAGARHAGGADVVEGVAVAFGGNVRRCLALVFTTRAAGAGAEAAVAERLAVVVEGVFATARTRSIDDRAPHRVEPASVLAPR